MRKHSARKWLHAILDLLPVIILPIFAVYSHRHTIDSYVVTVSENKVVEFNQYVRNGDFSNNTYWYAYNSSYTSLTFNQNGVVVIIDDSQPYAYEYGIIQDIEDSVIGHKYVIHAHCTSDTFSNFGTDDYGGGAFVNDYLYYSATTVESSIIIKPSISDVQFSIGDSYTVENVYVVDLTVMFGVGNEPTLEQFKSWYPNDYYEYNTGTRQLLKNYSTVTYDNTDIGSQMMYSLYKPINDYFNLNNVFNFGAIYDWFQLNMFNGNAPMSIYIVWNIIVYEFIMDIIFLIYCVFMFIIDFTTEALERFTGWAKRGD